MAVVLVDKDGKAISRLVIAEHTGDDFSRAGRFQWLCFPERSLALNVICYIRDRVLAGDENGNVQGYAWCTVIPDEQALESWKRSSGI